MKIDSVTEGGDDMCPLSTGQIFFLLSFENVITFGCGQCCGLVQWTRGLDAISHITASGGGHLHEFPKFASADDADTVLVSLPKCYCDC